MNSQTPAANASTFGQAVPAPSNTASGRHQEDRLGLTWRTVASSVVVMTQKAEKVATQGADAAIDENTKRVGLKELDESIIGFLRNRQEWLRIIAYLETKIEGRAKETEVLQQYHASMPRLNGKKRKREAEETVAIKATIDESTTAVEPSA